MALRSISILTLALFSLGPTRSGRGNAATSGLDAVAPVVAGRMDVTITEGTNMAAALSPDGSMLALDLLGRIWTLPANGGVATAITDPFGDARQPQWSPDGRRLAFQAYWTGDYDVWVVNADGSGLAQLTSDPFDDREPSWSPDGSRVVFSSDRGGTYDIWSVDVASGALSQLTRAPDNEYTPAVGPGGRRIAYVSDGDGGAIVVQDGSRAPRRVVDLDGDDGYSPAWSPDGAMLAWVGIGEGTSGLFAGRSDGSGAARKLTGDAEDVFPFRASWASGDRIVYTSDGHVRTISANGGGIADVPFEATVTLNRPVYRKRLRSFDADGPHAVKGIVSPTISPDGTTVLFVALGDLWSMRIGEEPRRLTDDAYVELDPAWSPDGTRIAYSGDRDGASNLYVRDAATGRERQLTTDGGSSPAWSPDGSEIAYAGGEGSLSGLRVVDVQTGDARTVRTGLNDPGRPSWSPDGRGIAVSALWRYSTRFREGVDRPLYLPVSRPISQQEQAEGVVPTRGEGGPEGERPGVEVTRTYSAARAEAFEGGAGDLGELAEIALQEGERWMDFAPHGSIGGRGTDGPLWSPNGRMIAYVASGLLWVVPVGPDGSPTGPPRRLNDERSSDPSWAGDSGSILYLTDDRLRRVWLDDGRIEGVLMPLTWEPTPADDRYVVHAGSLFDGRSSRLRDNIDIVVQGNRIVRVADHDPRYHTGRVVDASDGVVSPGLIEMHTHTTLSSGEAMGRQWLSYGVTSIRTPASDPFEMVEGREAHATRRRLGPRVFGTGNTIDGSRIYYGGAPALTSSSQVALEMEQADALSFDVMKTYVRLSDPVQRRVIEESHALGMPVTSHELYPGVAFGVDGVEHVRGTSRRGYSPKVSEIYRSYDDVIELLARSGMTITPTVGIYGGHAAVADDDPSIFDDPRVQTFMPWAAQAARRGGDPDVRRRMVSDMASVARRVVERGGTVVMGTDSPINPPGLALIVEMQVLVQYGGMTEIDAMRATTSVSADALGYGDDLGSIREGALADMIVLGSNPLSDIRAVRDVRVVIEDGRVHTREELLRRPEE